MMPHILATLLLRVLCRTRAGAGALFRRGLLVLGDAADLFDVRRLVRQDRGVCHDLSGASATTRGCRRDGGDRGELGGDEDRASDAHGWDANTPSPGIPGVCAAASTCAVAAPDQMRTRSTS